MKKEDLKIGWYVSNVDTAIPTGSPLHERLDAFCKRETENNDELYELITKEAEINNVGIDQIAHYEFLSTVNMIIHSTMYEKFINEKRFWIDGLHFHLIVKK